MVTEENHVELSVECTPISCIGSSVLDCQKDCALQRT